MGLIQIGPQDKSGDLGIITLALEKAVELGTEGLLVADDIWPRMLRHRNDGSGVIPV